MSTKRFERFRGSVPVSKRVVVTGFVVLMMVVAGCGGNPGSTGTTDGAGVTDGAGATDGGPAASGGAATAADGSTPTVSEPSVRTATATDTSTLTAGSPTALSPTAQSNRTTTGLDVVVGPTVANTTNVTLVLRSTVTTASATDGIETITVDAGDGLDLSTVSVTNVMTAGVDEGNTLPGNRTDGSLAANVEGRIEFAEDGEGFTIPFDGNRSIEPGDQIVVVIDGGVTTGTPGNYTFALTVNDAPTRTDTYNVTES